MQPLPRGALGCATTCVGFGHAGATVVEHLPNPGRRTAHFLLKRGVLRCRRFMTASVGHRPIRGKSGNRLEPRDPRQR